MKLITAVAMPKGQRGDWLLQKLTEVGIDTIIPLDADRSVLEPGAGRFKRWQSIIGKKEKKKNKL